MTACFGVHFYVMHCQVRSCVAVGAFTLNFCTVQNVAIRIVAVHFHNSRSCDLRKINDHRELMIGLCSGGNPQPVRLVAAVVNDPPGVCSFSDGGGAFGNVIITGVGIRIDHQTVAHAVGGQDMPRLTRINFNEFTQ